jgi:hypothetical protein
MEYRSIDTLDSFLIVSVYVAHHSCAVKVCFTPDSIESLTQNEGCGVIDTGLGGIGC